jgi:polysaccharide biosynthesis protein PslJ
VSDSVAEYRGLPLVVAVAGLAMVSVLAVSLAAPDVPVMAVLPGIVILAIVALAHATILSWQSLVPFLVTVIMIVPIRRYAFPGDLPFELEPYRVLVAFIATGWLASLLVDPRVRLRRTGFEGPFALLVIAVVGSIAVNPGRVAAIQGDVVKRVTFLVSFLLIAYVVLSVVRSLAFADLVVKTMVVGGAVVALFAMLEARTNFNIFNHLATVIPILEVSELPEVPGRGARLRVYASAQHPIALGAVLVMIVPLAAYLIRRTRQRRWLVCLGLLTIGATATVSRTAILMLVVVAAVYAWLRPAEMRRLWPAIVPVLVVVHFLLPGTLGSLKGAFFPAGGLVAEQQSNAGWVGSGRLADVSPSLAEYKARPFFGQGYGTRVAENQGGSAKILDNQWLSTLLETGAAGVAAWLWLFGRAVRRFGRAAKTDHDDRGWLLAAVASSIAAFAVGMFTYDAFAFIQVTFVFFLLAAVGAAALRLDRTPAIPH